MERVGELGTSHSRIQVRSLLNPSSSHRTVIRGPIQSLEHGNQNSSYFQPGADILQVLQGQLPASQTSQNSLLEDHRQPNIHTLTTSHDDSTSPPSISLMSNQHALSLANAIGLNLNNLNTSSMNCGVSGNSSANASSQLLMVCFQISPPIHVNDVMYFLSLPKDVANFKRIPQCTNPFPHVQW